MFHALTDPVHRKSMCKQCPIMSRANTNSNALHCMRAGVLGMLTWIQESRSCRNSANAGEAELKLAAFSCCSACSSAARATSAVSIPSLAF